MNAAQFDAFNWVLAVAVVVVAALSAELIYKSVETWWKEKNHTDSGPLSAAIDKVLQERKRGND